MRKWLLKWCGRDELDKDPDICIDSSVKTSSTYLHGRGQTVLRKEVLKDYCINQDCAQS